MADLEQVLKTAEELLSIPSVTGSEKDIADILEETLAQARPHFLVRAQNSICVAMRPHDLTKKTVMLAGHTDTVPEFDPNPVRREAGLLYGLGASDMKAAVALILHMVEQSRKVDGRYNLVGVLYAREEGPYDQSEMPKVQEAAREWFQLTDLAVCMEPTDNTIELGCLGTSHAKVTFRGKRAHSARPWHGDNAIHKAAGLLQRLGGMERQAHEFHGLTFYEVINATYVEASGARNVIPDNFVLNLNYRFAPGKDEAAVRAYLDTLIGEEASWELVDFCPAGKVCADNPILAELKEAAEHPEVRAKQAWTDVGRLSQMGIDAVNWGPGSTSQAHQQSEWVSIAEIEKSLQILQRWLHH